MAYGEPLPNSSFQSPAESLLTVLLLQQPTEWVPRIEEQFEFIDIWSLRRTTTLDISLPEWALPEGNDGPLVLPVALFPRSHHLTSLRLKTWDHDPGTRFVFGEERRIMRDGLTELFSSLIKGEQIDLLNCSSTELEGLIWDRLTCTSNEVGIHPRLDEWIIAKQESGQATALHARLLEIFQEPPDEKPAARAVALLDLLGVTYAVLTLCPRMARQCVTYETLERRHEVSSGVRERLQPKDRIALELFDVPKYCRSYHIGASAPKDMFLEQLEVRAEPIGESGPSPDDIQPQVVHQADFQNLGQFAHVRIARDSTKGGNPASFYAFQAVATLRNRPIGIVRLAPWINLVGCLACLALALLAGPHKPWLDPGLSATLLAIPGVLATLLALPTDHQIPIKTLFPTRLAVLVCGLTPLAPVVVTSVMITGGFADKGAPSGWLSYLLTYWAPLVSCAGLTIWTWAQYCAARTSAKTIDAFGLASR